MLKLTFYKKIALSILLTALFVSFLYTYLNVVREQSIMKETIIKEKMQLSDFLAITFEVAEAKAGIAYKYNLIEEIGKYEDVVYVRAVKSTGEIYLSTNGSEMGKFIKDPAIRTNKTMIKDDVYNNENIKVAVSPSSSGHTIWLGFSLKKLERTLYEAALLNFLVFLPIFAAIIMISFFLSRGMIGPIKKLMKGVENIGKGNLDYRIEIKSEDELGQLAYAFNQMVRDLKESKDKIEGYSRNLERQISNRTSELNEKVAELEKNRTAILNMMEDAEQVNRQLTKAQEGLKKAMEELRKTDVKKDEFISITAHEFKTPLTAIHGFAQLLQGKKIDRESMQKYLRIMTEETDRLAKLVTEILDLSRMDLGTFKFNFEAADLTKLVDDVSNEIKEVAGKKGLKLRYSISPGVPKQITTDPERLRQVLINLVINSVKYTPKGSIELKVAKEHGSVENI